jgi:dyslexia susceptibility 1 candidate gene 1 protein
MKKSTGDIKGIQWSQDTSSLNIKLPVLGVSAKKIDVFFSDLVVKVNAQEISYLKIFDLADEIDYENKENAITYENGILDLFIVKKTERLWDTLTFQHASKEDLRRRREESFARKAIRDQQLQKNLDEHKIKMDKHATKEIMRIEQEERDTIASKKQIEKDEAEKNIYGDLDKKANFGKTKTEDRVLEEDKPKTKKVTSDIFDEREVRYLDDDEETVEEPVQVVNEIRKAGTVPMKFTEKVYPHLASREQFYVDPPLPKTYGKKEDAIPNEESGNPLYLKDKGDELFKNGDFAAALNAYSSAYGKNPDLIEAVANRCLCFLQVFNYDDCIDDCNVLFQKIDSKPEWKEKYVKLVAKLKIRKGVAQAWKGNLDDATILFDDVLNNSADLLSQDDKRAITLGKETVQKRQSLNAKKKEGDILFYQGKTEAAKISYEKVLAEDPNHETSLSNLSLICFNLKEYEKAIEYCQKTLDILVKYKPQLFVKSYEFNPNVELKQFTIKVLLRKACSQENLGKVRDAIVEAEKAVLLDENHAEAKLVKQRIQDKITVEEVEITKKTADQLIKEKKFKEALEIYNECLKKIPVSDILTYLAISLNKTVCHLALNQFDDVISVSIRGLNLITSHKNKVISFGKQNKDINDKIQDFEIRFLVRRGNAYAQTSKLYHAKSDLEAAVKMDPINQKIKDDLKKVTDKISSG